MGFSRINADRLIGLMAEKLASKGLKGCQVFLAGSDRLSGLPNYKQGMEIFMQDDTWAQIIHGASELPEPSQVEDVVAPVRLVPVAGGLTQPNTTKPLAQFWGVSESAIIRWCKAVQEVWGERPVSPFTDKQLGCLATVAKYCSSRWAEFKGETGLAKRLSPAEFVQQQLQTQGRSSSQQLQQRIDLSRVTAAQSLDLQDGMMDRLQGLEDKLTKQVSDMSDRQFSKGREIGQKARAVLSGETMLAGFLSGLQDGSQDSVSVSLLPGE
jgi:hypothetical protein